MTKKSTSPAGALLVVAAPHFTAGVVLDARGRVVRADPVVAYMRGWSLSRVVGYSALQRWRVAGGTFE